MKSFIAAVKTLVVVIVIGGTVFAMYLFGTITVAAAIFILLTWGTYKVFSVDWAELWGDQEKPSNVIKSEDSD